ncbi:tyrosine-type recombinase/integrase [Leptolyngbya sp. FACHB-17]|uniref:tyrosine-type recombinase/integrase n=1 Tax=unclassified Leptolyngbya TaxID=2650499 RepID=UPI00168141D7|nr:tyrosine-type recombinase/integrase [Leptolyngbya sp. FACHB-17]MBD2078321.1 tyrosine-type recombinase/integrase [Leptolyngbya sp. FACHB-17]
MKLAKRKKNLPTPIEPALCCPNCGSDQYRKNGRNKSSNRTQIYLCKQCHRDFTPSEPVAFFVVDPQSEYVKDVWDCRRLGLQDGVGRSSYKLNFTQLSQPWLKDTAKLFLKVCLSSIEFSSAQEKLYSLRRLSRFLVQAYPDIAPHEINRTIITEFTIHLASARLAPMTRYKVLCDAKLYFDACYQNEWLDVSRYLVRQEDFPKRPKHKPRYIPEEVMQQLNQHIGDLAEPVMRMVLVLQECGMRISELVNLNFDCLLQDTTGDWFLRYYQFKMKKEITIPISREVVRVIQEQQRYIRAHLDPQFKYLFCSNGGVRRPGFKPVPRVMARKTLPAYLNSLAEQHNICDQNGKRWHFQTHQFRHTVGTRMINNGVPQHIVQRYLGHESPEMTATYAFIHDQTMKAEIAKFQGRVVNIAGQVMEPNDIEADDDELQWFKRNISAQALPNGSCALPTISQGCPHANACLSCTHFRTTVEHLGEHKKQLRQTEKIIEKATANGWVRQAEMNETVKTNLKNIIAGLEGETDDGKA